MKFYTMTSKSDSEENLKRVWLWAELHDNPETRDQMNALLSDLPETMQRNIVRLGQRIVGGLPVPSAKALKRKPRREILDSL